MDLLLRSALPLSVNLNCYATKVATHIELPAKLLNYFLRSNKSNINQNRKTTKSKEQNRKQKRREEP